MKQLLSAAVLSLACAAALAAGQVPSLEPADALPGHDRVELSLLPGARHGGPAFETAANMDKVFAFLTRVSAGAKKP